MDIWQKWGCDIWEETEKHEFCFCLGLALARRALLLGALRLARERNLLLLEIDGQDAHGDGVADLEHF